MKKLPDSPGIYLFYNPHGELIYVGKATSLKKRVQSYFTGKNISIRPIEQMLHEIHRTEWQVTESVLEAIIAEANAIKKYQPKYNVLGKDSKSWNYLVITKDEYPMLQAIREHDLMQMTELAQKRKFKYFFGPFPGLHTKATMKILRKLFWLSTCSPDATRSCLYYQMGGCLGVCSKEISPTEYKRRVIGPLVVFLKGGKKRVLTTISRRMKEAAKAKNFEEAARLRDQIQNLERIHDVALLNKSFVEQPGNVQVTNDNIQRIEGYDISNLGATGKVGSMVVFDREGPVKSEYRRFKIRTIEGQSDLDCLTEVLYRRFRHKEWKQPDLLLIDGGLMQVNRAKQVLSHLALDIPVVGIAKGQRRKKNEFILGDKNRKIVQLIQAHQGLLVRVRDEAHRFAVTYQRKLREIK